MLKHTPTDHPDHNPIKEALLLIEEVCSGANEAKRQFEYLEEIEKIQSTISNWEVCVKAEVLEIKFVSDVF